MDLSAYMSVLYLDVALIVIVSAEIVLSLTVNMPLESIAAEDVFSTILQAISVLLQSLGMNETVNCALFLTESVPNIVIDVGGTTYCETVTVLSAYNDGTAIDVARIMTECSSS